MGSVPHGCLDCGDLVQGSDRERCALCTRAYEGRRRHSSTARYGPNYAVRHRAVVQAEPWCHWPTGCEYTIDSDNPLCADHFYAVRTHGWQGRLVPLCRKHNSVKGARPAERYAAWAGESPKGWSDRRG